MRLNRRDFLKFAAVGLGALAAPGLVTITSAAAKPDPWPCFLTFDSGFSTKEDLTGTTIDVLDTLKQFKTPATFFPNGRNLNTWEGAVLVRIMLEGHALGNRLWQETGNLVADQSAPTLLAAQFFKGEKKLRQLLQSTNQDAAQRYLKQPRLYRRPGGDTKLAAFLDPAKFADLTREPYLKAYVDTIDWLKEVYDYSGWHIGVPKKSQSPYALQRQVTEGGKEGQSAAMFLCVPTIKKQAVQLQQGVIIQLYDADKYTVEALPQIITQLKAKGAEFKALPRLNDKPNTFIIEADEAPVADLNAACGG